MRPFRCKNLPQRRPLASLAQSPLHSPRRLTTLAIESSCDDSAVAILNKDDATGTYTLPFNERITSDHRATRGIEPLVAVQGHTQSLTPLIRKSLAFLPSAEDGYTGRMCLADDGSRRKVPDFVTVTRGPGSMANLSVGLNTAKGLAAAWDVPLVGAHHMMAHALTPRLVRALGREMPVDDAAVRDGKGNTGPKFPFLTLMISGGHTQVVYSESLTEHRTIVPSLDSAVGNVLDQAGRDILPPEIVENAKDVNYGAHMEKFAFPNGGTKEEYESFKPHASRGDELFDEVTGYDWVLPLPLRDNRKLEYSFSGIASRIKTLMKQKGASMDIEERRAFAKHTMTTVFRHVASRLCIAMSDDAKLKHCSTLIVAGGVACNKFLMHVLRTTLRAYGHRKIKLVVPPPDLCTDNAAMIAWTGMEMYESGWTTDLSALPVHKWPMSGDNGMMGVGGWIKAKR